MTITSTNTTFVGNVGLTTPLASLTTDANGTTRFPTSCTTVRAAELTLSDNVTTAGNFTLVATNATFGKSVNPIAGNASSINLNVSNNLTILGGAGNNLAYGNIISDAAGNAFLAGIIRGNVTTINDNATLVGDTSVIAIGNVTFVRNVDGGFNLTIIAITTTFGGNVGLTSPLLNLTTDAEWHHAFQRHDVECHQ